ncbi:gliding-motility protein MglA [Candidatus Heimdallarchaeota archaeon B3_Heim]|nr:MAG: gliding-motility protein MglA [Candidatus Heimdallarchaeota archaeon B3_Heim]
MRKDAEGRHRFKIVFYGPSLCGKTTTLSWLYHKVDGLEKGKFTQLADPHGRTLFFDFAPMQATTGVVFDVYTTAGQERHKHQRKIVIQGVDGILFVVDSSSDQLQENIASFEELTTHLGEDLGTTIPLVIALNKRDVEAALPRSELIERLKLSNYPIYETVATTGIGIKRAFQSLAREILMIQLYGTKTSQNS